MQDRLKQIGRRRPREVQQTSEWLGEIPGDHHAIGQLPNVARAGHPGLQKDAYGWCMRTEPPSDIGQAVETSNCRSDSAIGTTVRIDIMTVGRRTESNGPRGTHRKRPPPLA